MVATFPNLPALPPLRIPTRGLVVCYRIALRRESEVRQTTNPLPPVAQAASQQLPLQSLLSQLVLAHLESAIPMFRQVCRSPSLRPVGWAVECLIHNQLPRRSPTGLSN